MVLRESVVSAMLAKMIVGRDLTPWWVYALYAGALAISLTVGLFLILRDRRRDQPRSRGERE